MASDKTTKAVLFLILHARVCSNCRQRLITITECADKKKKPAVTAPPGFSEILWKWFGFRKNK